MTWDDHDIFDGWGSYPAYLQHSVVFQGIFQLAMRWYCVFQQHLTCVRGGGVTCRSTALHEMSAVVGARGGGGRSGLGRGRQP
jgi:hypothetical protein